jgi:replicative DNA helicase
MNSAPPQFLDGERAILGGLLVDNAALAKCAGLLEPADFYAERHRTLYAAMLDLFERNRPVDWITLNEVLIREGKLERVGGPEYLADLADAVPTAANVLHYVRVVRDKALLRRAIGAGREIVTRAHEDPEDVGEFLDEAERLIFRLAESKVETAYQRLDRLLSPAMAQVERLYERKEAITGVPSGFPDLDQLTAGFQPSDLVIVAGRPSMGKTALAMNMGMHASLEGVPTVVFSLEMSNAQLVLRLLCSKAKVDLRALRTGYLRQSDFPKLTAAAGLLADAPLFLDDTPAITALALRAKARRLKKEHGLGLIVVDYLQLMRGSRTDSREQEISEISRSLKALAKELDVPVIALSQLNRKVEERSDRRPQLSDLRESGAIEQDADVIIFIYRDEVYNKSPDNPKRGEAEIIVGKQRNGPVGAVKLHFRSAWSTFLPMAGRADEPAEPARI